MRAVVAGMALAAIVVAAIGCDTATPAASEDQPTVNVNAGVIRVAAAFPLDKGFAAAKAPFEAANPGTKLTVTLGPSQALRGQVQVGGFDVFAAEDLAGPQDVVAKQRAAGPAQVFATDQLVIVVPTANPAAIRGYGDLAKSGVRIAGATPTAPLTTLTSQATALLGGLTGAPTGYAAAVAAATKSVGDDPRAVVAAVAAGKADAAFAYATDAREVAGVTVVPLPDQVAAASIARLAVVVIAAAVDPVAASAFSRWLTTAPGRAALTPFGFGTP